MEITCKCSKCTQRFKLKVINNALSEQKMWGSIHAMVVCKLLANWLKSHPLASVVGQKLNLLHYTYAAELEVDSSSK